MVSFSFVFSCYFILGSKAWMKILEGTDAAIAFFRKLWKERKNVEEMHWFQGQDVLQLILQSWGDLALMNLPETTAKMARLKARTEFHICDIAVYHWNPGKNGLKRTSWEICLGNPGSCIWILCGLQEEENLSKWDFLV